MNSRTVPSITFITRLHAICHAPQLTDPLGAQGKANHHVAGPNHPGGRKNTGCLRYHQPTRNCAPPVSNHSPVLNCTPNFVRAEASSELSFSRSTKPLSTFLLSFAHLAKWSWELVCKSSCFDTRILALSSLCCETVDE